MTGGGKINLMVLIVSMPVGGVENLVLSAALNIDKKKYNVTICCIKELGSLGRVAKDMGINIIELNLMKSSRFNPAMVYPISKMLKKHKVHVLWTHQYVANLYGRMAAFLAKTPVVVPTFHVLYGSPKFHRRIFNYILSHKTDIMVSVSNAVASDMTRYDRVDPQKIKIIHPGIDLEKFDNPCSMQDARKVFNLPSDCIIIGTVGRITKQKGHRYLIEAASMLKNAYIVIAGDGPLKDELIKHISRTKTNCLLLGEINNEQIPIFLRSIDIFCFPSLWEGFPVAPIEAMASGLPIVASDIPPHREVMGDAGMLVKPADSKALFNGLKTLLENDSLRNDYAGKAKERAKTLSIRNMVKAYEDTFDKELKKKNFHD